MLSKHRTIFKRRMHELKFISKLDQWIPHQLIVRQYEENIFLFLSYNNKEPFLKQIVTNHEKCLLYCDVKRRKTVCQNYKVYSSDLNTAKMFCSVIAECQGNNQLGDPHTETNNQCRFLLPSTGKIVSKTHV